MNIKKVMVENRIRQIKKQLENLDALEAQARLQPMEKTDDTYLVVTHEDQRRKLLKELQKLEQQLKEASE
jgi:hypothetical protein